MKIRIINISPELVYSAWPALIPYADKLAKISQGRILPSQMLEEFAQGVKELWVVYDDNWQALGFWSQQIHDWGSRRIMTIDYVAGRDIKHWLEPGLARIDASVKSRGVDTIEAQSPRKGWARMIERYGFRPFATIYVKDVICAGKQTASQDRTGPDDDPRLAEASGDGHDGPRAGSR